MPSGMLRSATQSPVVKKVFPLINNRIIFPKTLDILMSLLQMEKPDF
jgi:hypothetical protein